MNINESCKCPDCSDSMVFDIGRQRLCCPSCGAVCDIEEYESSFRDAEPDPETVTCPNCGIALSPGIPAFTITCPCCGGFIQDKNSGNDDSLGDSSADSINGIEPDLVIPFALGREAFFRAYRKFCENHPAIPDDFVRKIPPESIRPVYLPVFLYEALAAGDISIEERNEDGDLVLGTRAGHFNLRLKGLPEPLSDLPPDSLAGGDLPETLCLEPWKISRARPCRRAWFCGIRDSFRPTPPAEILEPEKSPDYESIKTRILYLCLRLLTPDERITITSQYLDITPRSVRYVLCPLWLFSLSYHGETYLSVMNASTGKTTMSAPRSPLKFSALALGFSSVIIGLFSLVHLPLAVPLIHHQKEPVWVLLYLILYVPMLGLMYVICLKIHQFCLRHLLKGLHSALLTSGACFCAGPLMIYAFAAAYLPSYSSHLICAAAGFSIVLALGIALFSHRNVCETYKPDGSISLLHPDRTDFDRSYIDLPQSSATAELQRRGRTEKLPDPLAPLRQSE